MNETRKHVLELLEGYNNSESEEEKESYVEAFQADLGYIDELISIINEQKVK